MRYKNARLKNLASQAGMTAIDLLMVIEIF